VTGNSALGKVAVVAGASSGIGAVAAHALAADGYRVALPARRPDRIAALADELGTVAVALSARNKTPAGPSVIDPADRRFTPPRRNPSSFIGPPRARSSHMAT
jgi:NADP-dependent 3-hydroxy acid dehydrogenase YdfG